MAKVGIVTDTVSCLPPEKVEEYGIELVTPYMYMDGKEYRDRVDLTPDEFWRMYPDMEEFSTAAPSLAEFTKIFEELSKTTDTIACTFVSKALSATYENALQAKQKFVKENPGIKIEIVDSRIAAGAQGFIVLEMAKAAKAGKNLEQVITVANETIPRVKYVTALESLKRLIKIGRAPKTAYMGELFQVKPIIGAVNNTGMVENMGRARGKDKAMQKLIELTESHLDTDKPAKFFVHYTNSIEEGEKLKQMVESKFNISELYFTPFSPIMSGAVGPSISIAFYS